MLPKHRTQRLHTHIGESLDFGFALARPGMTV